MNKLGWIVLALIALLGTGFALLVDDQARHPVAVSAPDDAPRATTKARPAVRYAVSSVSVPLPEYAFIIPVAGVRPDQLFDSWHDARGDGTRVHEGIDIPAPGGTPVLAAHAGTIEKLFESRLGGTTAYIRSRDRNWVTYYAHLAGYVPALREGQAVAAGTPIGFVGDTGDAGPGNTHLHFALQRMAPGERWHQGTAVNPFPLLAAKASSR